MRIRSIVSLFALIATAACVSGIRSSEPASAAGDPSATPRTKTVAEITYTDGEFDGNEITKTDADWKNLLSPAAYNVLRQEGTERAGSSELTDNHKHGVFYCAACGLALFKSENKFDSGTGWPSFYQPIYKKNVIEKKDTSLGEERTAIECARCHGHLGHVFDDGPQPTGLRYCMNGVALKFRETQKEKAE